MSGMATPLRAVARFAGVSPDAAAEARTEIIEPAISGLYTWYTCGIALMERRECYQRKSTAYRSGAGALRYASNHCSDAHGQTT